MLHSSVSELFKPALGVVVGFVLAQAVNLAKLVWDWSRDAKLHIKLPVTGSCILSHTIQVGSGEDVGERIYAFLVGNLGHRVAKNVRIQLLSIEIKDQGEGHWRKIHDHATNLRQYEIDSSENISDLNLVPHAFTIIELGRWREDWGYIHPSAYGFGEYFEYACSGAAAYKFRVSAHDEAGRYATVTIIV